MWHGRCLTLPSKKGGKCLASEYKNVRTKYWWECKDGYRWQATANNIQRGEWCLHCAGSGLKDLQWLQDLAAKKGGRCLAFEYKNAHTKYWWECKKGHKWPAQASNIQQGGWCPDCAGHQSRYEIELRNFVRQFYPEVLDMPVKRLLPSKKFELDIWLPSQRKAIEFDGEYRHGQPVQMERDARKDAECLLVGIKLLRVKYKDYLKNPEAVKQRVLDFLASD